MVAGGEMSKIRLSETTQDKPREQADRDCDWIALHGWDWWRGVVADAEQRASQTAREDA